MAVLAITRCMVAVAVEVQGLCLEWVLELLAKQGVKAV